MLTHPFSAAADWRLVDSLVSYRAPDGTVLVEGLQDVPVCWRCNDLCFIRSKGSFICVGCIEFGCTGLFYTCWFSPFLQFLGDSVDASAQKMTKVKRSKLCFSVVTVPPDWRAALSSCVEGFCRSPLLASYLHKSLLSNHRLKTSSWYNKW